jgi:competence CoiA-like predicted nuclease
MEVESVRTITDVIDVETGELLHIDDYFFRKNEAYLFLLRRRLYEYAYLGIGKPKYLCAVCRQPVVLLGRKTRRGQVVYFAHYKDSDDCPIKTHSGEMSADDIRRTVYFGETEQHLELKHQIYAALQTSHITGVPFSHTKEEQRIGSKLDFRSWAVPDIYAECGELKINFEVQVNSMFLSTIIERDIYYRFHNIFIMWIFSPSAVSNETMGLKDIAWTNNGNVFVYDTIARQRTEASGELTLLCRWYEMDSQNQEKITLNKGKYVTLSDLTFDRETNAVYYEDVASKIVAMYPDFSKDRVEMEQREL